MRDRLLIVANEPEPERRPEWRAKYFQRPVEKLPADVVHLSDKITALQKEKNLLAREALNSRATMGWQRIWIRILTAAVIAQFTALGWLFKAFLDRFGR